MVEKERENGKEFDNCIMVVLKSQYLLLEIRNKIFTHEINCCLGPASKLTRVGKVGRDINEVKIAVS